VAEALIHEGAHQKFFDLATTRALFGAQRYPEIGDWLLAHGECLGQDGHALLGAVTGRRPERNNIDVPVDLGRLSADIADGSLLVREVGERTLVARQSRRAELFWIRSEALGTPSKAGGRSI
jgi:hypothetical protein